MAICVACGGWTEPPVLERAGSAVASPAFIVCPHCHHREPFARHPLWWIAGSSGSGKSTLVPLLRRELPGCIVFEGEAIDFWRFEGEPGEYSSLYNQWLKVAWEVAVNGVPVVFVATALPDQLDACTFLSRFSAVHYLGLVCDEAVQARRLRTRTAWRQSASPEFIAEACGFTHQLEEYGRRGDPRVALLDTTDVTPEETAGRIAAWVKGLLPHRSSGTGAVAEPDEPAPTASERSAERFASETPAVTKPPRPVLE